MLIRLSKHFNQSPDQISTLQLKEYLYHCKEKQGLSNSFINQTISAVKILRKDVLGLAWDQGIRIKRPRMNHRLPDILSKGQVDQLINPFDWLKYILEMIPDTKISQLHTLLPLKDNFDQTKLQ